ncbi:hypothetical protein BJF85_23630 [Saccharomonospora sp. CUA-673]|nr:hypothetical protein BJF85_23630 [Saccharomonospora sp. CUA-673]
MHEVGQLGRVLGPRLERRRYRTMRARVGSPARLTPAGTRRDSGTCPSCSTPSSAAASPSLPVGASSGTSGTSSTATSSFVSSLRQRPSSGSSASRTRESNRSAGLDAAGRLAG